MAMRAATVAATAAYDLIVSPVAPVAAFPAEWPMPWGEADEGMAHIGFTVPFSMSGQPACSVNAGFLDDGWTVGVQAVSYTHLRAHETVLDLVCRLLLDKETNGSADERSSGHV